MPHVPHSVSQKIGNALLRRLAPVRPEEALTAEEMEVLAPRVRRFGRYELLTAIASAVLLTIAFTYVLSLVNSAFRPAAVDPVYDSRSALPWLGSGLMLGFGAAFVPTRMLTRRWWGPDETLYYRYDATSSGYDPQRGARVAVGLCLGLGMFLGVLTWNMGEVVDAKGITFGGAPLITHHRTYEDVVEIGLYERFRAPIGVREKPNLRIAFRIEPPLKLVSNGGNRRPELLRRIADYVSERSAVPVTRGAMRPDN